MKDKGGANEVQSFLDSLRAYTFRYKDPKHELKSVPNGGKYLGVMAQDVEKTDSGKQIVSENEEGTKVLEFGPLISALTAGVGNLNERLRGLEKKGKSSG
jgi:hypothetical protein